MGTAYIWGHTGFERQMDIFCPEGEIDGDAFWIWTDGTNARVSFEGWEGQARKAAEQLLALDPGLALLPIAEDSLDRAGEKLGDLLVSTVPTVFLPENVERWYHGTCSSSLEEIFADDLHGDVPHEKRSWRVADVPPGVVFLAESPFHAREYADRAAAQRGGEPVLIVVEASSMDRSAYETDRDFPLLECARSWSSGALGDCSEAAASLTLTGKVGYRGRIPAASIAQVLRRHEGAWNVAEDLMPASISPSR